MDTALPQKFPFILDRNLAKANCTGNRVCTSCDTLVLGLYVYFRQYKAINISIPILNVSNILSCELAWNLCFLFNKPIDWSCTNTTTNYECPECIVLISIISLSSMNLIAIYKS